jgi:hypothetical protein
MSSATNKEVQAIRSDGGVRARLIEEPVADYRVLAMSLIVIIKLTHTIG